MKRAVALDHAANTAPYGVARGGDVGPAVLDFRGHNGTSFAVPYEQLVTIAFHPSEGITLEFQEHRIVVRGRNLRPVYDHLLHHRITFLREEEFDATPETDTFVDGLIVERLYEEA